MSFSVFIPPKPYHGLLKISTQTSGVLCELDRPLKLAATAPISFTTRSSFACIFSGSIAFVNALKCKDYGLAGPALLRLSAQTRIGSFPCSFARRRNKKHESKAGCPLPQSALQQLDPVDLCCNAVFIALLVTGATQPAGACMKRIPHPSARLCARQPRHIFRHCQQRGQIDCGLDAHPLKHPHQIFCRNIAGGAWSERAPAESGY